MSAVNAPPIDDRADPDVFSPAFGAVRFQGLVFCGSPRLESYVDMTEVAMMSERPGEEGRTATPTTPTLGAPAVGSWPRT